MKFSNYKIFAAYQKRDEVLAVGTQVSMNLSHFHTTRQLTVNLFQDYLFKKTGVSRWPWKYENSDFLSKFIYFPRQQTQRSLPPLHAFKSNKEKNSHFLLSAVKLLHSTLMKIISPSLKVKMGRFANRPHIRSESTCQGFCPDIWGIMHPHCVYRQDLASFKLLSEDRGSGMRAKMLILL